MSDGRIRVLNLEPAQAALRDHFLGWQCRIRQLAVREHDGRPQPGMRPRVRAGDSDLGAITTVLVLRDPGAATAEMRHMYRRTHDPAERVKSALRYLTAAYYQYPRDFSDALTALFGPGSSLADTLAKDGACVLDFEQFNQRYRLRSAVLALVEDDPAFQATLWHNRLFNPALPPGVRVLAFRPDWATGEALPPVF